MYLTQEAKVYPIYCPPIKFTNIYGLNDAYSPTNPSLWISESGSYILLIRLVNYRKFHDYTFTLSEHLSNSVYMIQRGENVRMLLNDTAKKVNVVYNLPQHKTYWTGPEDIRFINETTLLATVPELTPTGFPSIFRAKLEGDKMYNFESLSPNTPAQKNWMPYKSGWVYSVHPWVVYTPQRRTLDFKTQCLEGYHGSTNGVLVDGWWWFIIHDKKSHRWLKLRDDETDAGVSDIFAFFRNSYIEFCCSLSFYEEEFWIALGCNDASAHVVSIPLSSILKLNFVSLK
jgi:hypothetical protein